MLQSSGYKWTSVKNTWCSDKAQLEWSTNMYSALHILYTHITKASLPVSDLRVETVWSAHLGCHWFFKRLSHGWRFIGGCDATLSGGGGANCIITLKKKGTWQSCDSHTIVECIRTRGHGSAPHFTGVDHTLLVSESYHLTHVLRLHKMEQRSQFRRQEESLVETSRQCCPCSLSSTPTPRGS